MRAFEVNAVDYLLKPVETHLREAINRTAANRACRNRSERQPSRRCDCGVRIVCPHPPYLERIPVRRRDQDHPGLHRSRRSVAEGKLLSLATTKNKRATPLRIA